VDAARRRPATPGPAKREQPQREPSEHTHGRAKIAASLHERQRRFRVCGGTNSLFARYSADVHGHAGTGSGQRDPIASPSKTQQSNAEASNRNAPIRAVRLRCHR
jgi:hypothetical protein